MSDWIEVRLGDICEFISRGITPNYSDDGILVLNQKCIRDNRVNSVLGRYTAIDTKINPSKLLKNGDILINSTGTGTLGRVSIFKGASDCVTVDGHVTILRAQKSVSPVYLGYFLHSIEPLIENLGRGSTNQKELSTSDLKRIRIVLPDITTQNKVAEQLSVFDSMIDNNSGRIELLERAAQELYKEWFVRFRFPGFENTKFENGLPDGWECCRLSRIMSFGAGKTRPESGETYPVYGGNGILDYCNYYNNENAIVIGRVGAYCGTVYYEPDKCWISDNALFAESRNGAHFYNYYLLKNMNLNARQIGAGQPLITQGLLNKIKILLPPEPILKKYNELSSELLKQQHVLRKQNTNLATQRDMLLPRLMSGKLEV